MKIKELQRAKIAGGVAGISDKMDEPKKKVVVHKPSFVTKVIEKD